MRYLSFYVRNWKVQFVHTSSFVVFEIVFPLVILPRIFFLIPSLHRIIYETWHSEVGFILHSLRLPFFLSCSLPLSLSLSQKHVGSFFSVLSFLVSSFLSLFRNTSCSPCVNQTLGRSFFCAPRADGRGVPSTIPMLVFWEIVIIHSLVYHEPNDTRNHKEDGF